MEEADAEPFLHPRHRLVDRRRRHAELPSRNRETSGFRRLNEGTQRSQTVHPRTSTSDNQVQCVWNYRPFFKPSGEFICQATRKEVPDECNAAREDGERESGRGVRRTGGRRRIRRPYQLDHLRKLGCNVKVFEAGPTSAASGTGTAIRAPRSIRTGRCISSPARSAGAIGTI
jgi:hypothetical protein